MGMVLNFTFPPMFQDVLAFMRTLAFSVGFNFDGECLGFGEFYHTWLQLIVIQPLMYSAIVYCVFKIQSGSCCAANKDATELEKEEMKTRRSIAREALFGNAFFALFLCYPSICNLSFVSFMCTSLTDGSDEFRLLDTDDRVNCMEQSHIDIQYGSYFAIVCIGLAAPVQVMRFLSRKHTDRPQLGDDDTYTARIIMSDLDVVPWPTYDAEIKGSRLETDIEAANRTLSDIYMDTKFGYLVSPYRSDLYWCVTLSAWDTQN